MKQTQTRRQKAMLDLRKYSTKQVDEVYVEELYQ